MTKKFFRWLFGRNTYSGDTLNILKKLPNFRSVEEIENMGKGIENKVEYHLEKGKIETITAPDLGFDLDLVLSEWHVDIGQIVQTGDVICSLENTEITLEFESFFKGRIVSMCPLHQKLTIGDKIFQIEGI